MKEPDPTYEALKAELKLKTRWINEAKGMLEHLALEWEQNKGKPETAKAIRQWIKDRDDPDFGKRK
jgi:hypothetical protein